ncbi:hypothetical protein [Actinomadura xylanilytica]|uniref:hypothetical protein n=1 Tax=Actinomadura xylanilytica TaxID=887459 RepID=UPI00255AC4EE|nr:hypothetical protein [Actinomadura xylanilytica]MDL4777385.1 hypothetical protein [Actinomadura xylanilytica]
MDFSSAAHELYGVTPDAFMETRTRLTKRARGDGDAGLAKRIGALRRPTQSAWAVNLLSRSAGEELGWLLEAGAGMRSAWASGGSIGGLEQRRGELVALLVRTAGRLAEEAGHPLRDPAVREVEDTLQAATVDASVADEVREGRLTRPRRHSGFVPAGVPAGPAGRAGSAEPAGRAERPTGRARRPARESEPTGRADDRKARAARERDERRLAEREEKVASARDDSDAASAEVARLRRELDRAVTRRDAAARRLERAERARDGASEAVRGPRHESG